MYTKMLTVLVLLAAPGCTIAGMHRIPHYEIVALVIGIAACFVMALGFAITEKFHKQHIEEGTSRRRTWLFFSVVLVVFIFMLTCACSAEAFFDAGTKELTPEDQVRVAKHQKTFVAPWQLPSKAASAVDGTMDLDADEPGWRKDRANKAVNRDTYFVYHKKSKLCFAVTFRGKGNVVTATTLVPCDAVEKLLVNKKVYDSNGVSFGGVVAMPNPCAEDYYYDGHSCIENWDDSEYHYQSWKEWKLDLLFRSNGILRMNPQEKADESQVR